MSSDSSPLSASSLLHINRPAILSPQPVQGAIDPQCPAVTRTRSSRPTSRTHSPTGLTRLCSSASPTRETNAVASASQGFAYLNVPAVVSGSKDTVEAPHTSLPPAPQRQRQVTETLALLTTVKQSALGEAIPRERWQPDCSSALCSFPLCTTNFGPASNYTYFTLAPRRHHCRLCGNLFCADHTTQRAQLLVRTEDGKRLTKQRVCDVCLPPAAEAAPAFAQRQRRMSSWSEGSGESTLPSDSLMTPEEESPINVACATIPTTLSKLRLGHRSHLDVTVLPTDDLAPVEPWMGAGGILSLYPLAVNASHASRAPAPCPAVGPLFGPSASARRTAQEKELQRLTLRQRRMGTDLFGTIQESAMIRRAPSPASSTRSTSRAPLRTRSEERVRPVILVDTSAHSVHL